MIGIKTNRYLTFFKRVINSRIYNNKKLLNIIKIVITLGIFFILFHKVDIKQVLANLKNYNLFYLFINILLATTALQFFTIFRLNSFLKYNKVPVSFKDLTKIHYISSFFQSVFPSAFGTDIVKVYYLRNRGKLLKIGAIVFITRFIGFLTLFLISYFSIVLFDAKININIYFNMETIKIISLFILIIIGFILFFKPFSYIYNRAKKKFKILKYRNSI